MIDTPYQFKSLASRVRGMHGALDADELAKLLGVARVTILRRAKRGKIPSFRIGTMISNAGCSNKASSLCPLRRGDGDDMAYVLHADGVRQAGGRNHDM